MLGRGGGLCLVEGRALVRGLCSHSLWLHVFPAETGRLCVCECTQAARAQAGAWGVQARHNAEGACARVQEVGAHS